MRGSRVWKDSLLAKWGLGYHPCQVIYKVVQKTRISGAAAWAVARLADGGGRYGRDHTAGHTSEAGEEAPDFVGDAGQRVLEQAAVVVVEVVEQEVCVVGTL